MSRVSLTQFWSTYDSCSPTDIRFDDARTQFENLTADGSASYNELIEVLDQSDNNSARYAAYEMLERLFPQEASGVSEPDLPFYHSIWAAGANAYRKWQNTSFWESASSTDQGMEETGPQTSETEQSTTTSDATQPQRFDYHTAQGKIYHGDTPINLFGVNWFGNETRDHIFHGLWSRSYESYLGQIKSLGFNAVRVPFCPETLKGSPVNTSSFGPNPQLHGKNSLEILDTVLSAMNDSGIYYLLDHHSPDCQKISPLWYTNDYSEQDWIQDLQLVSSRYAQHDHFLGVDLKNEPHGAARWTGKNNDRDWKSAAERATKAVLETNPNLLVFIEGVENSVCENTEAAGWGGDVSDLNCSPLDVPRDKVVISPHVYGPDVAGRPYFYAKDFPKNMPKVWDEHFGFASALGYPVVLGEFGGHFDQDNPESILWQRALVDYMIDQDSCSFFYWALNPNSGDTGGLLEDNWTDVDMPKYANLKRLMDHCSGKK